jgi:hypothetical protein
MPCFEQMCLDGRAIVDALLSAKGTSRPPVFAPDLIARFRSHVDTSAGPNACHPWTLSLDRDGYGNFYPAPGVRIGAHRFALSVALGRKLDPKEVARHKSECTTRTCCNDAHLLPGTQADNIRDRDEAGRAPAGERNYRSKLTADAVLAIRRRVAAGETQAAIARDLGVGRKCVEHVVRGRNWKHVPFAAVSP